MIYFVDAVGSKCAKIGFATELSSRIRELQTGCPFEIRVIGLIDTDDIEQEKTIHRKLARWRIRGEWYPLHVAEDYLARRASAIANQEVGKTLRPDREEAWRIHQMVRCELGVRCLCGWPESGATVSKRSWLNHRAGKMQRLRMPESP